MDKLDDSEIDYKQQLINVANQVSNVSSTVSSGSYQISSNINKVDNSLGTTNLLLFILIIVIAFNTLVKWKIATKKEQGK
ncbi:hypothetical protein [Paenibacillus anaericanus]|nr:hypothetical protein [Paenibacillus anaericanus]